MVLAELFSRGFLLIILVIIGGLLLTWIAFALVSKATKSKSKVNTQSFSPVSPALPSQGQLPSSSKDHTALLVAIIGAGATIIAAVITALLK